MDDEATSSDELTDSHELISKCTPEQWDTFQDAIKMTELADLGNIADRIGSGAQETWQDYANSFAGYEWYQFSEAYQHCLDRPFVMAS